jgi:hypothetical protein
MTRLVSILLTVSACVLDAPAATVSVELYNRDRMPLATWPVAFHGADGRLLDVAVTDARGRAIGVMEPDGMVTYLAPFLDERYITHGGIQPGQTFRNVAPGPEPEPLAHRLVVTTSAVPDAARLCAVRVPCADRVVEARGVPGAQLVVDLPPGCARTDASGHPVVTMLASATDERAEMIAYAAFPALAVARSPMYLTVATWRQDLLEVPVVVAGLGPDLVRYRVSVDALVGEAALVRALDEGDGPGPDASATFAIPAGIAERARVRFEAYFASGAIVIEQRAGLDAPLAFGPAELPPRMIEA